jgi:hypothetical protein
MRPIVALNTSLRYTLDTNATNGKIIARLRNVNGSVLGFPKCMSNTTTKNNIIDELASTRNRILRSIMFPLS